MKKFATRDFNSFLSGPGGPAPGSAGQGFPGGYPGGGPPSAGGYPGYPGGPGYPPSGYDMIV